MHQFDGFFIFSGIFLLFIFTDEIPGETRYTSRENAWKYFIISVSGFPLIEPF